ncbi:uncharacterized protein F4812DRAFT_64227 [Daldinia caldariorum]|uniref:uncharacterized protein n=1 Tax=Daldinia caldariorum TaxID=326644 RepID=UPI002007539D|nr:uncharacterized protein F4812DRAFT_64227 [Daldinia caldariorum]KAI1466737.1 hypothetical protein F4812DRAFT_64227 [Daldinia caldariorum]
MRTSSLIAVAATVASAVAETTTATSYMTATITINKCSPDNTACPLYSSSTSSVPTTSSSISTPPAYPTSSVALNTTTTTSSSTSSSSSPIVSSTFYPIANSTNHVGPTGYHNATSSHVIPTESLTLTSVVATTPAGTPPAVPSASASTVPTGGAGLVSVRSGLLMGVVAMGAALLI